MDHPNEEFQPYPDMEALRKRLAAKKGKEYWRHLNELANSEEFVELVRQEFPRQAANLDFLSRRDFLKVLGAALAMGGLAACAPQGYDKILPYVNPPQNLVPGQTIPYASTMVQDGYAKGILVSTTMGRPIKIDGNPDHPDSQGASDVFMQASILEMYNPDRQKTVVSQGTEKTWQDFTTSLSQLTSSLGGGNGLRILSGPVTSPSLAAQIQEVLTRFPQAKWVQFSPMARRNFTAGANAAFGKPYDAAYDFGKADVVLSLDSDFLFSEPGHLRYSHDFALRHQPISANGTMNRLYAIESSPTITGVYADHRLGMKPSQVEGFARAIAARLGVSGVNAPSQVPGQNWLDPLAADLRQAGKAALIVAGERQPAPVHLLALAMNQALGSLGNTVRLIDPVQADPGDPYASLAGLIQELNNGQVDLLIILGENPVYTSPADLTFAEALKKAKQSVYLAFYPDETAVLATWAIPAAHELEAWGDARAFDGTISLIQPVIQPLYGGKSPLELLAALLGKPDASSYDLVRAYWQGQMPGGNFERDWRVALSKGIFANTAFPPATGIPVVNTSSLGTAAPAPSTGLEIVFEPDPTIWDGRFSNNAWLQELPKPLSKLTWDNAAQFSPVTAGRLGLETGNLVELSLRGRTIQAPVLVQPGQPDDVVTVSLGYGRKSGGSTLSGAGFNAYALQTSQAPGFDTGLEVRKVAGEYSLALTHDHFNMENRDLVRAANLDEYRAHPNFAQDVEGKPPTLYGEYVYNGYAWGMSINLNTCIGCNACVVACQAENNIPTVGKDQVLNSREMHWLRVDRYYTGPVEGPTKTYFEPVPCMQCEKAPCEVVCPVEATSHSAEGLNDMTYNRCVGTRYCSNNCPYKVRRFNFFKYVDENVLPLQAMRNPDVTVRSRGVMEKCTYCVQRITHARIRSEVEGRSIGGNEIKTACQQACPTQAIIFGNINDTNSTVRQLKDTPLNYGLLADLGTQPRTTYLGKVNNPNPAIQEVA